MNHHPPATDASHAPTSHPANLRLVAWEITRNCNLACVHCRASATLGPYDGELDTPAALRLVDQIARAGRNGPGRPILILTGGEPLLRGDIFDVARHGRDRDLRVVMATNGTLLDARQIQRMIAAGIQRISVSLDGATAADHDRFRAVEGAYAAALEGLALARQNGLEFQVNTTVTQANLDQVPELMALAERIGAVAHHIFLLVPTGRGKYILEQEISARQYEQALNWFYDQRDQTAMQLKATCAPHYYRILRQRARTEGRQVTVEADGLDAVTRGCLGGTGFAFISHRGIVQPCGFLDVPCGDVTREPFDRIWQHSPVFQDLRDVSRLKGKCGVCEYRRVCGGCRARAYEATGDYLAAEPLCEYEPAPRR